MGEDSPAITPEALSSALAGFSPEQRANLAAMLSVVPAASSRPRFSPAIDAIPSDKVKEALKLLSQAVNAKGEEGILSATNELSSKFPNLFNAAQRNSEYRQKGLGHSFNVAILRLVATRKELSP